MVQSILAYAVGTFVALFPIANPIGAVPIFYSLTETDSRADRRRQARRIAINVILILALFLATVLHRHVWLVPSGLLKHHFV